MTIVLKNDDKFCSLTLEQALTDISTRYCKKGVGIHVFNAEGETVHTDECVQKMYELSKEQLLGMKADAFVKVQHCDGLMKDLTSLFKDHEILLSSVLFRRILITLNEKKVGLRNIFNLHLIAIKTLNGPFLVILKKEMESRSSNASNLTTFQTQPSTPTTLTTFQSPPSRSKGIVFSTKMNECSPSGTKKQRGRQLHDVQNPTDEIDPLEIIHKAWKTNLTHQINQCNIQKQHLSSSRVEPLQMLSTSDIATATSEPNTSSKADQIEKVESNRGKAIEIAEEGGKLIEKEKVIEVNRDVVASKNEPIAIKDDVKATGVCDVTAQDNLVMAAAVATTKPVSFEQQVNVKEDVEATSLWWCCIIS